MYSQNNEEQIISNYFKNNCGESQRTLLDLGANDGKTLSNTLYLIENGWQGMLVEPSPTAFTKLCRLHAKREGVYCYEKAIGGKNGKAVLHDSGSHLGVGDTSLLSTMKTEEMERWANEKFNTVEVDCITFDTLMGLCPIKTFDFITIDIEGMEREVLPQMNLKALDCKMICVEWNGKDFDFFDKYCTSFGMKLINKNAENLIYAI